MLELVVLQQQQQRLEHGDGEQPVCQDRQQDMGKDARFFVDQRHCTCGGELRQQGGDRAEREQQDQQVLHWNAQARQQGQGDHCDGDQARGTEEVQAQPQRGDQLEEQRAGLGDDRDRAEQTEQALVGTRALGQAHAVVDRSGNIKAGGEQIGDEAG